MGHGASARRPPKESLRPCKAMVRELIGIERGKDELEDVGSATGSFNAGLDALSDCLGECEQAEEG